MPKLLMGIVLMATLTAACREAPSTEPGPTANPVTEPATGLLEAERSTIVAEISQALENYRAAWLNKDLAAAETFWSESEDFLFAGDGTILEGGRQEWSRRMLEYHRTIDRILYWEWRDVRVEPLASTAASSTVEFAYSWTTVAGDTVTMTGSWTYVFRKEGDRWRVIQSNGTHLPA